MAQEKNFTVWQRLTKLFGPEGPTKSTYKIEKDLLTTKSKEAYEKEKLEKQQSLFIKNQWIKIDSELYQQAVNYETTRLASYTDFEAMEFYPEIAAALDIFMEEATTPDESGIILRIYSESQRVKKILENLFYKRLDINTSLPSWTRNVCKYGDNFLYLQIDDSDGIIGVKQLPNIDMERREGELFDNIRRKNLDATDDDHKLPGLKFIWKSKEYEFNSWQIAHFRLLGDDRRLPYGTSILEKARRIWKQLLLSEDAMLIYRVTRAPERRIFKIFVGNIDNADVEQYVQQVANRFKRTPVIDQATGQIDLRYNQLAQDQDYFIPVRDPNASSPIDTLPGAANLSEIADVEYLQKKLFAALRIPKTFLGFEEATGEGKNLALQDVRFARSVNRVQQAMLQEMNKIAIIHLYMLGLEEDLDNFSLVLNNPSTQAEMLKMEHLQSKVTLFRDAVSDAGNGFASMSMTKAKREILGMSDDEIKMDLEQQRLEKAAAAELEQTATVIKRSGIFDKIDKIYGEEEPAGAAPSGEVLEPEETIGGGPEMGGGEGGMAAPGGEEGAPPEEAPAEEPLAENVEKKKQIIKENIEKKKKKYSNKYFDILAENIDLANGKSVEPNKIEVTNEEQKRKIGDMIKHIDDLVE